MGTGVVGKSRVPNNKAHRDALLGAVTTKVASVAAGLGDLFGAPKDNATKPKKKTEKKILSPDEQEKKDFEKDMQMNLVSKSSFINTDCIMSKRDVFLHNGFNLFCIHLYPRLSWDAFQAHTLNFEISFLIVRPRITKLAEKARTTSLNLTRTGIAHQEAGVN